MNEILDEAVLGDREALAFLEMISTIAHAWDDLYDCDKPMPKDHLNSVFWSALIELPMNSFYRANEATLRPVVAMSIINWRIANALEDKHDRLEIAYVIRSSYIDIAVAAAMIIGGADHAAAVGVKLRKANHKETPQEYLDHLHEAGATQ